MGREDASVGEISEKGAGMGGAESKFEEGVGVGGAESKPRDLGSDRGYRVVTCRQIGEYLMGARESSGGPER
jgi:hypothetical protein